MIFTFRAELRAVIDGDTLELDVYLREQDLGFRRWSCDVMRGVRFRVMGIDTPERSGPTRQLGNACKVYVELLLRGSERIEITSHKLEGEDGAFGRYLVDVRATIGGKQIDLATHLVGQGYAQAWDGKGRHPVFDPAQPYPLRSAA